MYECAPVCVGRAGQEAVDLPCNYSSQKANGQKGGVEGEEEALDKREGS